MKHWYLLHMDELKIKSYLALANKIHKHLIFITKLTIFISTAIFIMIFLFNSSRYHHLRSNFFLLDCLFFCKGRALFVSIWCKSWVERIWVSSLTRSSVSYFAHWCLNSPTLVPYLLHTYNSPTWYHCAITGLAAKRGDLLPPAIPGWRGLILLYTLISRIEDKGHDAS